MAFNIYALLYSLSLVASLLGCLKLGHMWGRRHHLTEKEAERGGALDGVIFALLGLLLAFSFSGAITRYSAHRDLLTKEANSIAEFHTKLDLLPLEEQAPLRALLRRYAEARFEATQADIHSPAEKEALAGSQQIQKQMWEYLVESVKNSRNAVTINSVIDAFITMAAAPGDQLAEEQNHVPLVIYALIFLLSAMSTLVAGYGMGNKEKLPVFRIIMFSLTVVATVYTILDLEYPRTGLFNAVSSNQMLVEVINGMR